MTLAPDIAETAPDAEKADATAGATIQRVLAFHLGTQRYALPIERVREIQQIVAFSEVPSSGSAVVGMVNLRGVVVPAVDMRRVVGLESCEYTLETPMIMTDVAGQVLALLVDEVQDVFLLDPGCLQESPALHALSTAMIGVARMSDGLVYVLDIDALVGPVLAGGPR